MTEDPSKRPPEVGDIVGGSGHHGSFKVVSVDYMARTVDAQLADGKGPIEHDWLWSTISIKD
jgi:hypothetical protein